jgi:hypothetical protein
MNREPPPDMKTDADTYDEALDHLVDTRGVSYDDARRELGPPPYEISVPAAAAISGRALKTASVRRRPRSGHGPQFGEEEGVGYPNGEPPYYQPYVPLSEAQAERNTRWAGAIRRDLDRRRAAENLKE